MYFGDATSLNRNTLVRLYESIVRIHKAPMRMRTVLVRMHNVFVRLRNILVRTRNAIVRALPIRANPDQLSLKPPQRPVRAVTQSAHTPAPAKPSPPGRFVWSLSSVRVPRRNQPASKAVWKARKSNRSSTPSPLMSADFVSVSTRMDALAEPSFCRVTVPAKAQR